MKKTIIIIIIIVAISCLTGCSTLPKPKWQPKHQIGDNVIYEVPKTWTWEADEFQQAKIVAIDKRNNAYIILVEDKIVKSLEILLFNIAKP